MAEKTKILLSVSDIIAAKFLEPPLLNDFNPIFCLSAQEIIQQIDLGLIPAVIIMEDHSVLDITKDLLEKIETHTTMQSALNFDLFAKIPTAVFLKDYSTEAEIKLLQKGVSDVINSNADINVIYYRIKRLSESFTHEFHQLTKLNNQHKNAITRLSQVSSKTGIYNKHTFIQKTQEMLAENKDKTFTFLQFDIDRFKVFNDLFGFVEGDKILLNIGEYFITSKQPNTIYGHIYADHFIICAPKESIIPEEFVKKITDFTNKLFPQFDFIIRLGLYDVYNDGKVDISLACDRTQLALHSIKTDFTARFAYFNAEMIEDLKHEQELITDMVIGIKNNEFKIYIQPQYDYTTDSISGAEALVRWLHPAKGLISPSVFIPIFERNGFITQLDQYIWEKTCFYIRQWIDEGLNPVPISVNISRRDIYNQDLTKVFSQLLKKYNLKPEYLRLEITESAYMDNPSQLINVVQDLRRQGFCLEMDDFGSGYSSLNTLKDVPVDVLKLDMQFIIDATENIGSGKCSESSARSGSILSSVVRMANWLHLPIIAEGIESKEQADYLKSLGCFFMQGYYFAKPMPAEDFRNLLQELPKFQHKDTTSENVKNKINFLDSNSQHNLLFNSFVGGAAIIEWTGEKIEIIRMNDQYLKEIGTTREDYKAYLQNLLLRVEEKSRHSLIATLAEAVRSKKMEFCEIECLPLYNNKNTSWIRVRVLHIANTATSDIFYISIENIDLRMHLLELNTTLSEQLATIMENVPCGILLIEYTGKKFLVNYVNETASKICGYEQSEFRVKMKDDLFKLFIKTEQKNFRLFMKDIIMAKIPFFSAKTKILCKDKSERNIQFSGNVIEQSNGSKLICAVFIDIENTEQLYASKYTSFLISVFNEAYEIDVSKHKYTTLKNIRSEKQNLSAKFNDEESPFIDQCIYPEDLNKLKRFMSLDHLKNINGDLSICDYRVKIDDKPLEYRRCIIFPNGNNKLMCCCLNITDKVFNESKNLAGN
ncbi:MAG: EAL domain-containing protein [Treponema sp.]|nr:EAL domain-containing protein [Treponema sp.]